MVRDFNLIRVMLKDIQDMPPGKEANSFSYPEYEENIILEHVELIFEAKLVKGQIVGDLHHGGFFGISRLTWEGHDFINASSNDEIWEKAKKYVIKPGVAFTFDLLKEWLKNEAKSKLGLP